jgi:hypothetical protein
MINATRVRWTKHAARAEEITNAKEVAAGKPERDKLHDNPRRGRKYNIKTDLETNMV